MNTLLIVEVEGAKYGYQLNSHNFEWAPKGRIRIARYGSSFWIERGLGYYGDTYFRAFIRKWKYNTNSRKKRLSEKWHTILLERNTPLNMDILSEVASFL